MPIHSPRAPLAALLLFAVAGAAPVAGQANPPRPLNPAELTRQTAALYPAALRDSAVQGQVMLRFRVRADSTVDPASITVVESSHPAFAEPAAAAARALRFAPAGTGDAAGWMQYPLTFRAGAPWALGGKKPPAGETYELGAIEEIPSLTNRAHVARQLERHYPPLLRDAGISGEVVLRFRILTDGTVDSATVRVMQSTHEGFAEPAATVARQARFRPARLGGVPVRVWVEIPLTFSVQMAEPPARPGTPGARR